MAAKIEQQRPMVKVVGATLRDQLLNGALLGQQGSQNRGSGARVHGARVVPGSPSGGTGPGERNAL